MRISARMTLILLGLAVLLSGCSVSLATKINEDGSGNLVVMYIFPKDTYTCTQAQREGLISKNVQWQQGTTSQGNTSCSASEDFNNLSQLRRSMENSDIVTVRDLKISNYVLTYDVDVYPRAQSSGIYTMYWFVDMPGKIVDHNADETEGNLLGWKMTIDQRNRVFARSQLPIPPTPTPRPPIPTTRPVSPPQQPSDGSSNNSFLMAILALGGFLVIGGIVSVVVVMQRQRAPRPPVHPVSPAGYAAPPVAPPPAGYSAAPPTTPLASSQVVPPPSAPITPPAGLPSVQPEQKPASVEERLQRLKELHDRGLIGDEEFRTRQRAILEDL